eukprot:scaffold77491_cov56-Attheya_sp.AAC.2
MHRLLPVYRHRCDQHAAAMLLVLLSRLMSRAGMVGVGFIDISLVKAPAVKRGGCGACGKGTNGGKRDETVFWGDTKPVMVCGAAGYSEGVREVVLVCSWVVAQRYLRPYELLNLISGIVLYDVTNI